MSTSVIGVARGAAPTGRRPPAAVPGYRPRRRRNTRTLRATLAVALLLVGSLTIVGTFLVAVPAVGLLLSCRTPRPPAHRRTGRAAR